MRRNNFLAPFLALSGLGLLGILSLVPSLGPALAGLRAMPDAPALPDTAFIALMLVQPTILLFAAIAVGVALAEKAGLVSLILRLARGEGIPAIGGWGKTFGFAVLGGAAVVCADLILRKASPASFANIPRLDEIALAGRTTALLYGGIAEELIMRFGAMTLLVWLIFRLTGKRRAAVWAGIAGAALLFAAGHIPALLGLTQPDGLLVLRTLGLNAALGLLYGWLYASRSLEHAMLAHGATHVVFWVATPVLVALGL